MSTPTYVKHFCAHCGTEFATAQPGGHACPPEPFVGIKPPGVGDYPSRIPLQFLVPPYPYIYDSDPAEDGWRNLEDTPVGTP